MAFSPRLKRAKKIERSNKFLIADSFSSALQVESSKEEEEEEEGGREDSPWLGGE